MRVLFVTDLHGTKWKYERLLEAKDSYLQRPTVCPQCGAVELKDLDIKEEMVRLAEQQDCQIEVVNESEALSALGGVGCLLRYRLPDDYA